MGRCTSLFLPGILVCGTLTLAGCGGGGGSTGSTSGSTGSTGSTGLISLGGVVIEGSPVSGSSVCVSSVVSGQCDSTPASVTTGSDGKYNLASWKAVSTSTAQVIATVPQYTDPTTKVVVKKHTLVALINAPAQVAAAKSMALIHSKAAATTSLTVNISPFATLIAQRVNTLGVSPVAAAEDVASSVGGVSANSLLQDYSGTTSFASLQSLALVLASQMGQVMSAVQQQMGSTVTLTPAQESQAVLLAASMVSSILASSTQQLQSNKNVASSQIVASISAQTNTITNSNVNSLLSTAASPSTAVSGLATTLNGAYSLGVGWGTSAYDQPAYLTYAIDPTTGTAASSLYDFNGSKFTTSSNTHASPTPPYQYILINNEWIAYSGLFQDVLGGGLDLKSFQLVNASNQNSLLYSGTDTKGSTVTATAAQGIPVSVTSVDVSNQNIAGFLGSEYMGDNTLLNAYQLVGSTTPFPAGSTAYTLSITAGATTPAVYVLTRDAGINTLTTGTSTPATVTIASLANLLSTYASGSKSYLYVAQDTNNGYFLQFGSATSGSGSANLVSFPVSSGASSVTTFNTAAPSAPISLAYSTQTVNGVSMVQISTTGVPGTLPSILGTNSGIIFAVDPLSSQVDFGWQATASGTQTLEQYFFNSTAFNAIEKAKLCPSGC